MFAAACSESNCPQPEVGEEIIPFLDREIALFLAGCLVRRQAVNARWCAIMASGWVEAYPIVVSSVE